MTAIVLQFPARWREADESDTWAPAVAHRDERMPSGWWIVPAVVIGAGVWATLLVAGLRSAGVL